MLADKLAGFGDRILVLPDHIKAGGGGAPGGFGDLHGHLFKHFLGASAYRDNSHKPRVICLSVSSKEMYHRAADVNPILGVEYRNDKFSPTDEYFAKMGMKVRYFMLPHSVAPFAFYHTATW